MSKVKYAIKVFQIKVSVIYFKTVDKEVQNKGVLN